MKKTIKKGEYAGLKIINESTLENEAMIASLEIPTKKHTTVKKEKLTPSWCCNGDLDKCPAPCGACLQSSAAPVLHGKRYYKKEVLNKKKFFEQNQLLN